MWDASSGTQRRDLPYQSGDPDAVLMMHSSSILALAISRDSELLASGSSDGCIRVWRILTGACVRRYEAAHSNAVTSLSFSRDTTHILSSSLDGTARVHGLKSGRMLRELRGHDGFVHCAVYTPDCEHIVTGGSDSTLRVWVARTGDVLRVSRLQGSTPEVLQTVLSVCPLPGGAALSEQQLLVCTGERLQMVSLGGAVGAAFGGELAAGSFVAAASSPHGDWLYGLTQAGELCCFRVSTGKLENRQAAHEGKGALGLAHHPHLNLLASFGKEGLLKLWAA